MTIKGILLAGAALCTISIAPALASSAPKVAIAAARTGGVVKTAMHAKTASALTYTFSVYTGVSVSTAYKVKTNLGATFYTWLSNDSLCQQPAKEKLSFPSGKKTTYAKLSAGVETYSEGCGAPTKFYGTVYYLDKRHAANQTDTFQSDLKAKFKNGGAKYDGSLFIDGTVAISK